ncbi:isopeptide-forming domain-containing protein [Bifidobacterium platyrrhinorum]|uniref:Cell surface protein n=1 Tax=Bifidobacterium platyrrhinorum TaxID=2661628 RepID=A0A6L9SVF5_9BIFI|nr:cell surface protein [Bifidobacterium platyrrhinorum]NEG56035.1 cell surface protein [Bifidobacterium platyrrhinorum]
MADMHNHAQRGAIGMPRTLAGPLLAACLAIAVLFAAVTGLATAPATARAAAVTGSLTIDAQWDRGQDDAVPLAGDTYSIVRVASADLDDNGTITAFHTLDAFSRFDADWAKLTSSQLNAAAKRMDAHAAEHRLYATTGVTDANGRTTFTRLAVGIYLVARTHVASANTKYTCDPFLVSVPDGNDLTGGAPALNVTVEPKFGDNGTVTPPEPGEHDKPANPGNTAMTGADIAGIGALTVAVGVAGLVFAAIRRRARSYESDATDD